MLGPHGIQMQEQAGLVVKHMHMRLLSCVGVDIMRANQKKKSNKKRSLAPPITELAGHQCEDCMRQSTLDLERQNAHVSRNIARGLD